MNHKLDILEQSIGYCFKDQQLLVTALTHCSYANEQIKSVPDNERLEFLGDAVLELVSSNFLFDTYPNMTEGELTKLRASLVCEQALFECAGPIGLADYILLGKGEEKTGGRKRKSIVSDALEALIGAMYLDGGMESADTFIRKTMLADIENRLLFYDCKTALQEILQSKEKEPVYRLVKESGPDHCKEFTMEVCMDNKVIGTGVGHTKKEAQQMAAREALRAINKEETNVS